MLTTTFRMLREHDACRPRYRYLSKQLGGIRNYGLDTPISLEKILDINGPKDALWALRAVLPEQAKARDFADRLLAARYAELVLPIYESHYPTRHRVRYAVEMACCFAYDEASRAELTKACLSLGAYSFLAELAATTSSGSALLFAIDAVAHVAPRQGHQNATYLVAYYAFNALAADAWASCGDKHHMKCVNAAWEIIATIFRQVINLEVK